MKIRLGSPVRARYIVPVRTGRIEFSNGLLARLFLEQYDLLENRIVLPLDAHAELFATANEDALKSDVSLQRSDLLLISCDTVTSTLHFQIVEVKLLTDLGSFSAQVSLEESIEQQINNTISVLHHHFKLHPTPTDRLDRHLKHKELISLLSFYLARSLRYGLIRKETADVLRTFIRVYSDLLPPDCQIRWWLADLTIRQEHVLTEQIKSE